MLKTLGLLILMVSFTVLSVACGSDGESSTSPTPETISSVGYTTFMDTETGIMIYITGARMSAVQIDEPTVTLENLTDENFPKKISRTVDKERGVVIYKRCSGFSWMTCSVEAVMAYPQ